MPQQMLTADPAGFGNRIPASRSISKKNNIIDTSTRAGKKALLEYQVWSLIGLLVSDQDEKLLMQ